MIVITIDQRKSRSGPDKVESLLSRLASDYDATRGFERTAGDEIQGVFEDGTVAVLLALDVAHTGEWSVGIGVGSVQIPLPRETRAGRGPAFEFARDAVERAKNTSGSLALSGPGNEAERLEAELQILALVNARRTESSAEAGILVSKGLTQRQVAATLEISQQAVSARLASGLWYEAARLADVAGRALDSYSMTMDEGGACMNWIAWVLLILVIPLGAPRYFADSGLRWPLKQSTTSYLLVSVLALAGIAAAIGSHLPAAASIPHELVIVASVAAATLGGGPVTETVFRLAAFKGKLGAPNASEDEGPSPLRGGMWIGLLERAAIASTLWASWPEGLAVVLAVKGLGRFSELKQHAAAEQFILGTFVSVLWACAAVGVGRVIGF